MTHENRVVRLFFLGSLPATILALGLLWTGNTTPRVQWTATILIACWWLGFGFGIRERVMRPLQTLSNLIAALAEGDFSIRARSARPEDALGLALLEVNQLTETLREQRLGAVEATALLRTVMGEIDVAILAFDDDDRLRLINNAGARLVGAPIDRLLGRHARSLGIAECLEGETPRVMDVTLDGGRWELRRGEFRQEGRQHRLVVLSDLSRTLREEERQAWKRLVRVLSHEINNSLAPISSLSQALRTQLDRDPRPEDWDDDLAKGLDVIGARAQALIRFMQSYARLARLPPPQLEPLDVGAWIQRAVDLETRLAIVIDPGPPISIEADSDQLDQLMINILTNAVDAAMETGGGVRVSWEVRGGELDVRVVDDGPGLVETTNLFVPFYTTKRRGTGIGLVLSRAVAEAHGGVISLENREGARGCLARLRLPLDSEVVMDTRTPLPSTIRSVNVRNALIILGLCSTLSLPLVGQAPRPDAPAIASALARIRDHNEWTLDQQAEICAIPAPPFGEAKRGIAMRDRFRALGLQRVRIDRVGNVVGERPGRAGGRRVALTAHLDTVFPDTTEVHITRDGGVLTGPGIGDDCRGLAVVLTVARVLAESPVETDATIVFVATVGEEGPGNLRGVRHLFDAKSAGELNGFVSVDGAGLGLTSRGVGSHRYRVKYHGPGGHSFGAFGMPSPIHALGRAIAGFSDIIVPTNPKTTFNVGIIEGGTSVNSIAMSAAMDVDMRSESQDALDRLDRSFRRIVQRALEAERARWSDSDVPLEVAITEIGRRPASAPPNTAPIVRMAVSAAEALDFVPIPGASSTDSNYPLSLGIPAVTIDGGGSGSGAHSLSERYDDGHEGWKGPQWALLLILGLAGVAE